MPTRGRPLQFNANMIPNLGCGNVGTSHQDPSVTPGTAPLSPHRFGEADPVVPSLELHSSPMPLPPASAYFCELPRFPVTVPVTVDSLVCLDCDPVFEDQ